MKKMIMTMMIAIAASSVAFGQTKMSKDSKVEAQIIALEKAGWEAWKNKDNSWTRDNVTEEFLLVNSEGVAKKTQVVKSTATDCEVKSYSLDNFKFVMTGKDSALMTTRRCRTACAAENNSGEGLRLGGLCQARRKMARSPLYGNTGNPIVLFSHC